MAKQEFQTEVSQLLQLIIHSLYSHPEIFLRELISNSSDALDKLRHLTLVDDAYKALPFDPRIDLTLDEANSTLTIADTGIGMNEEDLVSNLGTIARSGTKNFVAQLSGDQKKDSNLIGQFGVGFYSAFMVADSIEVVSRKAGEELAWRWVSDGKTGFDITPAERLVAGTTITLHFNEEGKQYANSWRLQQVVKKYSNHIAFPIFLTYDKSEWNEEEKKSDKVPVTEQVNAASALWRRPKSELTDDDYKELYKSISGDSEDPLFWFHTRAEGSLEYTTLFFIPAKAPFDIYQAEYKVGVKLYVKRVFIMDDAKELLPPYLRFVRGIIDSEDLPLNVSREILQQNRVLTSIRTASVKKILTELKSASANQPEKYLQFITEFNRPLKEGLYSDFANRELLLDLIRFKSTQVEGLTSLADVKTRMKEDQKSIYYITGGAESLLRTSPLLEIYRKKGIEVLILDEDFDELVFSGIEKYGDIELKSVNKILHQRRPQGRLRARKCRGPPASARQAQVHSRRPREGCACLHPPRRQPLLHRLRRGGTLAADAADAACDGPEGHPLAQAHARNQPRSRDRQEAACPPRRCHSRRRRVAALRPGPADGRRSPSRPRRLRAAPEPRTHSLHLDLRGAPSQTASSFEVGNVNFCMLQNALY